MTNQASRPLALIILDGWDDAEANESSIINRSFTPNYDAICAKFPKASLVAGNDAIAGHLTIGAGRNAETEMSVVENALRTACFAENEVLNAAMKTAAENGNSIHLIGLLSDAGIHSLPDTIFGLLRMAKRLGNTEVFVHCILDGRDVDPRTADIYLEALEIKMADIGIGRIATVCGRFFAMDIEENWERTARAFTMLVHSEGERAKDAVEAVRGSFLRGIADEFIAPIIIEDNEKKPVGQIKDSDAVIFFNHRGDGMRQIVRSLSIADDSTKPHVETVCLTEYDKCFELPVAFQAAPSKDNFAELIDASRIANFRITDATRSNEITAAFNCGVSNEMEQNIILPAADVLTLESEPEMKSFKIADSAINCIVANPNSVYVVNLPAAATAAEIGSETSAIEAIQYIDTCLGGVVEKLADVNGVAIITSSHAVSGKVPFHIIDTQNVQINLRENGSLSDIAPTMLSILGLNVPAAMTGKDLRAA